MAGGTAESGKEPARLEGEHLSRPEPSVLVPLVRMLAQAAARETWFVFSLEGSQHHDEDDRPAGRPGR